MILGKAEEMGPGLSQSHWKSGADDSSQCPDPRPEASHRAVRCRGQANTRLLQHVCIILTTLLNTGLAQEGKATV